MFMNIEIKKKLYTAPAMSVVEMRGEINLLQDSGTHGDGQWDQDATEYDDEFSFIFKDSDRKA